MNSESTGIIADICIGDMIYEKDSGLEAVVVFVQPGFDIEDHGFVDILYKEKGRYDQYQENYCYINYKDFLDKKEFITAEKIIEFNNSCSNYTFEKEIYNNLIKYLAENHREKFAHSEKCIAIFDSIIMQKVLK